MPTKPPWLKIRLDHGDRYRRVQALTDELDIHTVCRSARCPNIFECWNDGTATFMILGDVCTRACRFCAVKFGLPTELDLQEPDRVAAAVARLGLGHVVITAVARDDLADGGAAIFAATIKAVRGRTPATAVEVLVPDFGGQAAAVAIVMAAGPAVFNHNLETVARLTPQVRSRARYRTSLQVLATAARWAATSKVPTTTAAVMVPASTAAAAAVMAPAPTAAAVPASTAAAAAAAGTAIKSGLMLGLGEQPDEVRAALKDLRQAGCSILTLGQYLQPSPRHLPVHRYVPPAEFDAYRAEALAMGFSYVAAGPLVRSSYRAHRHLGGGE